MSKKETVKREFAYLTSFGDLAGPYSKTELTRELTESSFEGTDRIKNTKVFKMTKIKATITPAVITIGE